MFKVSTLNVLGRGHLKLSRDHGDVMDFKSSNMHNLLQ